MADYERSEIAIIFIHLYSVTFPVIIFFNSEASPLKALL
jgi:hypothetical protein